VSDVLGIKDRIIAALEAKLDASPEKIEAAVDGILARNPGIKADEVKALVAQEFTVPLAEALKPENLAAIVTDAVGDFLSQHPKYDRHFGGGI